MTGAVFWLEMVRATRRGWLARLRHGYALFLGLEAGLCLLMAFSTMHRVDPWSRPPRPSDLAPFLEASLFVLWWQQVAVLLLAVPAFVAGSVTDEKTAGTLDHLLTAPLTDWEILAGKWAAGVVQMLYLVLPALPLAALVAGLGGLPPDEALRLALGPLLPLPALVAAGLLVSTLYDRTAPAILSFYLLLAPVCLACWWMEELAAWSVVAALPLLAGAAFTLRPLHDRQVARAAAGKGLPPIDASAVRWKERVLGGRLPVLGRVPRWLGTGAVVALVGAPLVVASITVGWLAVLLAGVLFAVGSALLVGVCAAVSVSGEREKGTWESLLTIPSPTEQILRGKLWGLLDAALPYQTAYLLAALPGAMLSGASGVLALAMPWLAGWMMMYYAAAVGLDCSTRAGGSWRALVQAVFQGAGGGGQRAAIFGFLGAAVGAIPGAMLGVPFQGGATGFLAVVGLLLLAEAEARLETASVWVAQHERVPQGGERFRKPV